MENMRCPNCGKNKFATDRNTREFYCTTCGFVIDQTTELRPSTTSSTKRTGYSQSGKGLGTRTPRNLPFYNKLRRWHATEAFSSNEERSFKRAMHVLRILWGKLNTTRELKEASSLLYRHCIKLKLTNGRNTYTMCFAVMSIVLEKFGVESDLRKIELDFEVDENLTHKYVKTINKNTKRFRV